MAYGNYNRMGTLGEYRNMCQRGLLGEYGNMCPTGVLGESIGQPYESANLVHFLCTLSPGILVTLQYDDRPPATGVFQGFENGAVILTNFNGFPGLVRIAPNKINAISPFVPNSGNYLPPE